MMFDAYSYCRWYYSNDALSKNGRSFEQVKYVDMTSDEVGKHFWQQLLLLVQKSTVLARNNFYFSWFIRGNRHFDPVLKPEFAPPYLTENGFQSLKVNINMYTYICYCSCILHA